MSQSDPELVELTALQEAGYSAWLREQPTGMLYNSLPYLRLITQLTSGRLQVHLAMRDGRICGALPLVSRDGPLGTVLNSLPFYGSHGGALAEDEATAHLLMAQWNKLSSEPHIATATMVENILDSSGMAASTLHEIQDYRIGQMTNIACAENHAEVLMERFHSKTRNVVRKSEKQGFTVAVENDALEFLYRTHVENLLAIGGIAKREDFFKSLPESFIPGQDYAVWVARHDGEPVAAVLLFYFRQTVEYFTPVIVEKWREAQPLSLLIYRSMIAASEAGYQLWNWGGTWATQGGVYHFKKRWGAEDRKYHYYTHVGRPEVREAQPEDLLRHYPGFFVLPFSQLNSATPS